MDFSRISLYITIIFIAIISIFYYPKWNKGTTEATISWDVSGYYFYLPAFLIYQDVRKLNFSENILKTYRPTPELQQAFKCPNENYILKYSSGQAIMMLPAFYAGHIAAKYLGYNRDGFSKPYQFAIFLWGILVSILGLILLRKVLLVYFSEVATGLSVLIIAFGTNYLEYGAITNAMTHNYLFTLYALLLLLTIRFYKKPTFLTATGIGLCLGLMVLTRPTEILAIFIPLCFGLKADISALISRIKFFLAQFEKIIVASFFIICLGSLQLFYWKFVSGSWIVYSYEEQGFSWLRPHIIDGLLSGRAGWLIYTPVMLLSLIGFFPLSKQQKALAPTIVVFSLLFLYVTFAWDIWWYGGSIGQRALVQIYPVLAFPLAAFIQSFPKVNAKSTIASLFVISCSHYNIWLVHQAHYGGLLVAGEMTSEYLTAIFMRNELPVEARKLLDTRKIFEGDIKNPLILMTESDSTHYIGNICLTDTVQFSPSRKFSLPDSEGWLRASADFKTENKEWDTWKMTQMVLKYYKNGKETRSDVLRAQRHLNNGEPKHLYLDSKLRYEPDEVEILFWNSDSKMKICVENIQLIYHKGDE